MATKKKGELRKNSKAAKEARAKKGQKELANLLFGPKKKKKPKAVPKAKKEKSSLGSRNKAGDVKDQMVGGYPRSNPWKKRKKS